MKKQQSGNTPGAVLRARWDMQVAGQPSAVGRALTGIARELTEHGCLFDEDFITLREVDGSHIGIRLFTAAALTFVVDAMPRAGISMRETDRLTDEH
jgi:hypothetical protein